MSNKVELNTLTQVGNNETAFLSALNDNLLRIQKVINDTLTRTGAIPNQMEQALDMNGFEILNVKSGTGPNDIVTREDIQGLITQVEQSLEEFKKAIPEAQRTILFYVQDFVNAAKEEIEALESSAKASADIASESATSAAEDASQAEQHKEAAEDYANISRIWADGNDSEVQPLGGTHSSMVSSGLAYAYAVAPEDVPVEEWATAHDLIVQGEKGDKGDQGIQGEKGDKGDKGETQDISHLATKEELEQGLATKQDKGDYATVSELTQGLSTKQPVGDYATKGELNSKQNIISDLSAIRSGASKGTTAVQPGQLATVAFNGSYNSLKDKPSIPTKTSQLTNDTGYTTKSYVDTTEQEIIENYMSADTSLQTQITSLSGVVDAEKKKVKSIEDKIPASASSGNLLATATDVLNATQDVRADFAEADTELQTQITGLAGALEEVKDDAMSNMSEIADLKTSKQDTIADLDTIRSGASKGSTAVQPDELPTKTSELENDSGFITIASLSGYATQDWVQGLGYITGINASDVTTALGYTPLKAYDLSPYAKTETVKGWLRSKQDKLTPGEGIDIDDEGVISATGGGGGGDVVEAIAGESINPSEIIMTKEWDNPYRMQTIFLGGDLGLSVDDMLELPEATFSKTFSITNGERETEFSITSMNDKYNSYFRFNSNQFFIDYTGSNGVYRNLTISLRYGTVYYADSERGDFEFDLYDVMNALNTMING